MDDRLRIESAEKEIELVNEKRGLSVTVLIAPYDIFFLGKITEASEKLDGLHEKLKNDAPNGDYESFARFYAESREIDAEMRGIIDGIFNAEVCNTLFPTQSMFALAGGMPTWANILTCIIDQLDESLEGEKRKAQDRIRKYSAKYKK